MKVSTVLVVLAMSHCVTSIKFVEEVHALFKDKDSGPKHISRPPMDISHDVMGSESGVVFRYKGMKHLWRAADTISVCYKQCLHEQIIICDYYYLISDNKQCVMLEQNYLNSHLEKKVPRLIEIVTTKPVALTTDIPKIMKKSELEELQNMIKDIQNKFTAAVKSWHHGTKAHGHLIQGLKLKQNDVENSVHVLSDKFHKLKTMNAGVFKKMSHLDDSQKSLAGQVKNMITYQLHISNTLNNLDKKVSGINAELNAFKLMKVKLTKLLNGEITINPRFNQQIIELKQQMLDLMSRVEMNPTLLKLTKNQRILAEALEIVDHEITENEKQIAEINEHISNWDKSLMSEIEHRKTLNDALKTMSTTVRDIRIDMANLRETQIEENNRMKAKMRQMKSGMEDLEQSSADLREEVAQTKSDMTHLVKDLVKVQASAHDSKKSILDLVETNKDLALDYHQLKSDQNQMTTQIQTLASVYKSVLTALHNLEQKQIKLMNHLARYQSVAHTSNDYVVVQGRRMQKLNNLPLLTEMRNFQSKLLKQINELRSDLLAVHQQIGKRVTKSGTDDFSQDKIKQLQNGIANNQQPKSHLHVIIHNPML